MDTVGAVHRRTLLRGAAAGTVLLPAGVFLSACEGSRSGGDKAPADSVRARTLMLDFHGGRIQAPKLFNPFVPGFTANAGSTSCSHTN